MAKSIVSILGCGNRNDDPTYQALPWPLSEPRAQTPGPASVPFWCKTTDASEVGTRLSSLGLGAALTAIEQRQMVKSHVWRDTKALILNGFEYDKMKLKKVEMRDWIE
jgi:hypothetical protein